MTSSTDITPEDLHAYFDGELTGEARARVEAMLAEAPEQQAQLDDFAFMRGAISSSLEEAAAEVPQARFEQVWDQIDREIDREARLQQAADSEPGVWERVGALFRGVRGPLLAAGAAAVALIVIRPWEGGSDPANTGGMAASNPASEPAPKPAPPPTAVPTPQDQLAQNADSAPREAEPLPDPERNDADIQRIEFGGRTGRVSQIEGTRGTTTVIWVTEEEPSESERPL